MSLAGFKKQINKANQFVSEKIGGVKGTELDDDFITMEKHTDALTKLVDEMGTKCTEYLQPNPVSRSKMMTSNAISKLRGQAKTYSYPQPEGNFGDVMIRHGGDMSELNFGQAAVRCGEAMKQMADIKYSLEENVKQNFLTPLEQLKASELKEVHHHRKKMEGRRLDYDCKLRKKMKGGTVPDEEISMSEEKFEESKLLAEQAMHNLLNNDVEQISQLETLLAAQMEYHRQALQILEDAHRSVQEKRDEAVTRPKTDHVPKRVSVHRISSSTSRNSVNRHSGGDSNSHPPSYGSWGGSGATAAGSRPGPPPPAPRGSGSSSNKPSCRALYDFDPENEGELEFKEGDLIILNSRIDENWYEGSIRGKTGYFPVNYVEIVNPL